MGFGVSVFFGPAGSLEGNDLVQIEHEVGGGGVGRVDHRVD
jgi:hypothetical protein